mgnify:FL=1
MNEYIIKLTQQELNNLKVFLGRTTLSGNEAVEFMKIVEKIGKAEVVKDAK